MKRRYVLLLLALLLLLSGCDIRETLESPEAPAPETVVPTTEETVPATIPSDGDPNDVTCKGSYTECGEPDTIVTASGTSEMFEKLIDIHADDVVLAFSFPRYSAATAKGAQYCRTTGATVIGFTDSQLSPLGQNSDYVLLAKSDMLSLVDSLVAPLSLINALIVALAAGRGQVLAKNFDALERVWEEYNVYEKRVDGQ